MIKVIDEYQKYPNEYLLALSDKIKAIIYARVSTNEQAEKGYSLQSQIEKCAELAQKKFSYRESEILAVLEKGEMGDNPDRPGINHVLYLLEHGIGKKLILLHPDRLSRYLALQNELASKVWSFGVDLEFVEFEIDPMNPESILMFNIQGSIAQYNKAKILANSKRGRRQKVKQGKIPGIRRVFGYTFDKENDILVENNSEKKIYLLMVDWLLNGKDGQPMNCSSIARELAKANYPAPASDRWYQATVSRIFKNPIYTGNFYYGKSEIIQEKGKRKIKKKPQEEWYAVPVSKYIDCGIYNKIQERLEQLQKKNRGRKSDNYLLKSLLSCGQCGAAVVSGPVTTLKNGEKLRYYSCSRKAKKSFEVGSGHPNQSCSASGWRQDIIDEAVWSYLFSLINNPEKIIKEIAKEELEDGTRDRLLKEYESLSKIIRRKEEEEKRIFTAYREEIIEIDIFKNEYQALKQAIYVLNRDMELIKEKFSASQYEYDEEMLFQKYLKKYREIIDKNKINQKQKRELILSLVEKVILHEDMIEIVLKGDKKYFNLNNS